MEFFPLSDTNKPAGNRPIPIEEFASALPRIGAILGLDVETPVSDRLAKEIGAPACGDPDSS